MISILKTLNNKEALASFGFKIYSKEFNKGKVIFFKKITIDVNRN
jgi:hypothetical protein